MKFNGKITEICREDETKCGVEGKFYKAKEPAHEPYIFSCHGCKFYEPSFKRCKAFTNIHELTGKINLEYSDMCRRDENKCGKYGKYYTPYKI
jgi:hypothetical protein